MALVRSMISTNVPGLYPSIRKKFTFVGKPSNFSFTRSGNFVKSGNSNSIFELSLSLNPFLLVIIDSFPYSPRATRRRPRETRRARHQAGPLQGAGLRAARETLLPPR